MRELALFAGIGGGLLGSRLLGWRTVCAIEISEYCRSVLLQRQRDKHLDYFPIWDDVRTFDGRPWRGCVDIVSGGFPCQPYSLSGKQAAESDERNLWPETIRVIREVGCRFVWLENVSALLVYPYFGTILRDLAESGYCVRWDCLPAAALGAPHERDRIFILGWTQLQRSMGNPASGGRNGTSTQCGVASAKSTVDGRPRLLKPGVSSCGVGAWSGDEPERAVYLNKMDRMADGVADRMDCFTAIGNGQVPAVVRTAWELLGNGTW